MSRGKLIEVDDLPANVRNAAKDGCVEIPLGSTMEAAEKAVILATVTYCKGNKSKAADILGLGRKTVIRKIQEYEASN